ncbi:SPOR domain-containing protein [Leeia aquatica]|uniref:SPOR domain-containing protein n=1 Tax=Leeia aquatica TaxID=2725557 RepID=A0A847RRV2_9NEIS|nr:SPOR domain-containing protein [Leeia aquatica]NLR73950.1 SPOR domain-containing protein [Leeia aquatica]
MNAPSTEVRQQAIRRLLIGIALILVAIVVLNALSRLKESQRRELLASAPTVASLAVEEPVASQPAPAASTALPASAASEPLSAASQAQTASAPVAASVAPKPQPPVVLNHTGLPPVATTPAATTAPPVKPQAAPAATPPKPSQASGAATAPTSQPKLTTKPQAAPSASPAQPATPPAAPPTPQALPLPVKLTGAAEGQYQVQLGLFSHPDNATALLRRLQENGVAAHLESRVVLGPFKDKASAKAAVAQLRALGVQPIVVGGGE